MYAVSPCPLSRSSPSYCPFPHPPPPAHTHSQDDDDFGVSTPQRRVTESVVAELAQKDQQDLLRRRQGKPLVGGSLMPIPEAGVAEGGGEAPPVPPPRIGSLASHVRQGSGPRWGLPPMSPAMGRVGRVGPPPPGPPSEPSPFGSSRVSPALLPRGITLAQKLARRPPEADLKHLIRVRGCVSVWVVSDV